jgi:streptomycin 6-kinase
MTMLHGDLHFDNIMRANREPWLSIDPKGWSGTAAFDTFTVIIGRREDLATSQSLYAAIVQRVYRFAAAALVHPDLALAWALTSLTSELQLPDTAVTAFDDLAETTNRVNAPANEVDDRLAIPVDVLAAAGRSPSRFCRNLGGILHGQR